MPYMNGPNFCNALTAQNNTLIKYNREQLLSMNNSIDSKPNISLVSPTLIQELKHLGLLAKHVEQKKPRTHRGKEGGTRRLKNLYEPIIYNI